MNLPVDHFYTITHVKYILLIQFIYARSFSGQRTVSLAGKRANVLQNIVSTTFANSNCFYQIGLNPLRLVQTIEKDPELGLIFGQGQCGKDISTRK